MTRKRKLIIAAVALAVVAAIVLYYAIPVPLADDPSELSILNVRKVVDGEQVFVTLYVDHSALANLLRETTCSRFPYARDRAIWVEVLDYRIEFLVGEHLRDFRTITVEDDGVFLHTTHGLTYRINDAERFAEAIAAIIG